MEKQLDLIQAMLEELIGRIPASFTDPAEMNVSFGAAVDAFPKVLEDLPVFTSDTMRTRALKFNDMSSLTAPMYIIPGIEEIDDRKNKEHYRTIIERVIPEDQPKTRAMYYYMYRSMVIGSFAAGRFFQQAPFILVPENSPMAHDINDPEYGFNWVNKGMRVPSARIVPGVYTQEDAENWQEARIKTLMGQDAEYKRTHKK